MNDRDLEALLRKALLGDGRLSSQPVEVSVSEAVVRLSGRVQSYRRKLLAQSVASSFPECRDVINELEVEPLGALDDEGITARTRAILEGHADIDKHTITVSTRVGFVTLQGTAGSEWERLMAEDVALSVRGVRGVKNLVLVDPEGRLEDQALSARVQAALERTFLLGDSGVQTAVDHDVVVLSGRVRSLALKDMAHEIARQYSPRYVRNEIVIEP